MPAKPLVFVHGFACTHSDWRFQLARFGEEHDVFSPDLRGRCRTHGTLGCREHGTGAGRGELVTGVGHFPQLEAPEQVNELLSGLIGM